MPKCTYTPDLLIGYVLAKMDQLRKIVFHLENTVDFTLRELVHIRTEILEIDAEVQLQAKMIKNEQIGPKMMEFRALLRRAVTTRERREQRARANEEDDDQPRPSAQFEVVEPQEAVAPASPTRDDLAPYASDNEDPLPLELKSIVRPARNFQPIRVQPSDTVEAMSEATDEPVPSTSRQADLRDELDRQRLAGSYGVRHENQEQSRETGAARGRGANCRFEQSRIFVPSHASERSRSDHRGGTRSVSSMSSHASYVSAPQERFDGPVTGRTYPPVQREPPTPLVRNDPSYIGMSEIYTHPPQGSPICPLGQHKLYRCTSFLRMGLQEKWYTVLKKGLCLNCLIRGHSHFTCDQPGACYRCGRRHDSKLCPEGPNAE